MPTINETRDRKIGCGYHPRTEELLHEEFAIDRWDGSQWVDTHERWMWMLANGKRIEKRWKLGAIDLYFLGR